MSVKQRGGVNMTKCVYFFFLIAGLLLSGCTGGTPATSPAPAPAPTVAPASTTAITFEMPPKLLPPATVGEPYSFSFATTTNPSGGNPPYTFFLGSGVGFPPSGLILDLNGSLSGTPTVKGESIFEVCVKDLSGNQACEKTSLTVLPADPEPVTYSGSLTFTADYLHETSSGAHGATGAEEHMDVTISFSDLTFEGAGFRGTTQSQGKYSYTCTTTGNYNPPPSQTAPLSISLSGDFTGPTFVINRTDKTDTSIELGFGGGIPHIQNLPRLPYLASHPAGIINDVLMDLGVMVLNRDGETVQVSNQFVLPRDKSYSVSYSGTLTLTKE